MRIAVFGATGVAGSAIVAEAHTRGHHVTALSRAPDTGVATGRLAIRAVDVTNPDAVDVVLVEADVAVLAIRLAPGDEDRLAPLTVGFLDSAGRHDTRVLVVGGVAPLRSPDNPDLRVVDDPRYVPEKWRRIARASLNQFHACQDHPYDGWTYLSPPAVLESGEGTGHYRRGTITLLTDENGDSRITASDLAIAVADELEAPRHDQHFTIVQDRSTRNQHVKLKHDRHEDAAGIIDEP